MFIKVNSNIHVYNIHKNDDNSDGNDINIIVELIHTNLKTRMATPAT